MTTRRLAKAAEAIRETVSTTVLFELRDPRVKHVTVLHAVPAPDLRTAKVYISIMGTPKQQSLCMHGLNSARGFIQAKLADRMQTKYTPVLTFVLDPGIKRSAETSVLLREILDPDRDDSETADSEQAESWDESDGESEHSQGDVAETWDGPGNRPPDPPAELPASGAPPPAAG